MRAKITARIRMLNSLGFGENASEESGDCLVRSSRMSLTITIDRTEGGRFRALVAEQPRLVIEHDALSDVVEELKRNLDMIAVMPDGGLLLIQAKMSNQTDEAAGRGEVEKTACATRRSTS